MSVNKLKKLNNDKKYPFDRWCKAFLGRIFICRLIHFIVGFKMSQYIDEKFVKLLRSAYKEKGNMILIYKMMQKGTQKKRGKELHIHLPR